MKGKIQAGGFFLAMLSLAILGTIYLAWLLYPLEIQLLQLESLVYMKAEDIAYNFNHLMQYLTNPLVSQLAMPNFSTSASGLHHFEQVKGLFHLTQLVGLISLFPAYSFFQKVLRKGGGILYQRFFVYAALAPLVLAFLAVWIGFDAFFTLFHQLLFVGDSSWLFNPATDPVIYILPETFFLQCFLVFFVLYELFCGWTIWQIRKRSHVSLDNSLR